MLLQILLMLVVGGLLVLTFTTSLQSTKGTESTSAIKKQLLLLQSKFASSKPINPEAERQEMEKLQNAIKTSSNFTLISGDDDLKQLFSNNCNYIQLAMNNNRLVNRTAWIKFNDLMIGFNNLYFRKHNLVTGNS